MMKVKAQASSMLCITIPPMISAILSYTKAKEEMKIVLKMKESA